MKKIIYSFIICACYFSVQGQSIELRPSDGNEIKIKGNVGGATGTITGGFVTRSFYQDAFLSTESNHPLSFRLGGNTRSRLNPSGDFGVGGAIALSTWDGSETSANNNILSRLHVYGVGTKNVTYGGYYPFHSAILGQAYGSVTSATNRAGIIGMTDGQSSDFNIGVLSIPTSVTGVSATSVTYSFFGYNNLNSTNTSYGSYNYLRNAGTGTVYAGYNTSTGTRTAYGQYNSGYTNGTNFAGYGSRNYGYSANGDGYGAYNEAYTYSNVNGNFAYGSYNYAFTAAESEAYGSYGKAENATQASGFTWGETFGSYGEGINNASSYAGYGVYGIAKGTSTGSKFGVYGYAQSNTGTKYGVYGYASGTGTNYAGYFLGNASVTGTLSKGGGSFKIDHPLDPANKYLYHSFVESPDMMNIYNGNATTDANGMVEISLPTYFEALNREFRYQLTTIGQKADAWVAEEIKGNSFKISTDKPNVKVSWQVTGIRHDAFANANRIPTEVDKPTDEKGKYLHPEANGVAASLGLDFEATKEKAQNTKKPEAVEEAQKPQRSSVWPLQMPKVSTTKENESESGELKK